MPAAGQFAIGENTCLTGRQRAQLAVESFVEEGPHLRPKRLDILRARLAHGLVLAEFLQPASGDLT